MSATPSGPVYVRLGVQIMYLATQTYPYRANRKHLVLNLKQIITYIFFSLCHYKVGAIVQYFALLILVILTPYLYVCTALTVQ